jgi:hypothetical protein
LRGTLAREELTERKQEWREEQRETERKLELAKELLDIETLRDELDDNS